MKDVNKVILMGRLGSDPIQRKTQKGTPVVHFPLATTRRHRLPQIEDNDRGELREDTQWHQVVVWGKQGTDCAQFLRKGDAAYLEGTIRSHTYSSKDGSKKYSFEIHAEDVSFVGGNKTKKNTPAEAQTSEQEPTQDAPTLVQ